VNLGLRWPRDACSQTDNGGIWRSSSAGLRIARQFEKTNINQFNEPLN